MIQILMQLNRFDDLRAHRKDWIQRGHRLLKDHAKVCTPHTAHRLFRGRTQIDLRAIRTMKHHFTLMNLATTKFNQPHDRK